MKEKILESMNTMKNTHGPGDPVYERFLNDAREALTILGAE
ncbi:hypothetical protein QUF90_17530 [Desulfococcaceae bacterium HSG9]|nr:hypothetical protein [Desulfococcaceae bacterium HSG9]